MRRFLEAEDADDPIQSVINVVDVFLVIVAMLLIMVARSAGTIMQESAQDGGDVIPEVAQTLERFERSGEIGQGEGVRAGTTYRLADGTLVFVPDE